MKKLGRSMEQGLPLCERFAALWLLVLPLSICSGQTPRSDASVISMQASSAQCYYWVGPSRSYNALATLDTVVVETPVNLPAGSCPWTASSNASWLQITYINSGSSNGFINISVAANPGPGTRVGTITVAGQTFTATQSASSAYMTTLAPAAVTPPAGSATAQTFTFTFNDGAGYTDLSVVDVLINNYLDGEQACYFALVPAGASSGYLYLVDDAGDGGYVSGTPMLLPSSGTLQNSQCMISGNGSSISGNGYVLTVTLAITFNSAFAGNKIFYMAARSSTQNSGWQPLGTWNVPGLAPTGPAVDGMSGPAIRPEGANAYLTIDFADTAGYSDLAVLDVLTNSYLDGITACYFAYVPTTPTDGYVYLVDDAGDGGYTNGSPALLSSGGILANNQCLINLTNSSAYASGNGLTLNVSLQFSPRFAGNQIVYAAARNNSTGNSGWQAVGSVAP